MKKLVLVLLSLIGFQLSSQTNNFPPSGNVGIGTSTATAKLEVLKNADLSSAITIPNSGLILRADNDGNDASLRFGVDNTNLKAIIQTQQTTTGAKFDLLLNPFNGNVGIGTSSPEGKLHVSSGTDGDAILRLEADTDNNNESDNPLIQLRQDGGALGVNLGFSDGNFGSNIFGIGTRYSNIESWDTFTVNTQNGNVGIGTSAAAEKLHVNGLIRIPMATSSNDNSPGVVLASNDDFLYDGQYINHYGFGFHGYNDGSSSHSNPANSYVAGYWGIDFFTSGTNRLRISQDGIVTIGTTVRQVGYKLAVNGKIRAKEIKVETGWADYVFKEDYDLPTLEEVEQHIKERGHLINIPSAEEVQENGIELGEMNKLLLEKIEELTLYTLQQQRQLDDYKSMTKHLQEQIDELKSKKGSNE